MLNKADLVDKWDVEDSAIEELAGQGWSNLQDEREDRRGSRGDFSHARPEDGRLD